jgi:hypothetical protein
MFRDNEIIFLLGAGCSVEAEIPHASAMISDIESKIDKDDDWKKFKDIYNLLKSSVFYSRGIRGNFGTSLNIEELVNLLNELVKRDEATLFAFIGTWNPKLIAIAGHDFKIIEEFKNKILVQLKNWINLKNYTKGKYYEGFFKLQRELNFPIRIFSLNYDLCLERSSEEKEAIERGFDPDNKTWKWSRFEANPNESKILLYKMHGSIDWERDEKQGNLLKEVQGNFDKPELIFGTNYKLQYVDPYLFYAYEFRQYSLDAKYIVTIGYGFNDEHINGMIKQALQSDSTKKVLSISFNTKKDDIQSKLLFADPTYQQLISVDNISAKTFLEDASVDKLKTALQITDEVLSQENALPEFNPTETK